jgi:hypothetical protein
MAHNGGDADCAIEIEGRSLIAIARRREARLRSGKAVRPTYCPSFGRTSAGALAALDSHLLYELNF